MIRNALLLADMLFSWSDTEYLRIVNDVRQVIETIQPDLVLVDPLCAFGIDACRSAGVRTMTLSSVSWSICVRMVADEVNRMRFLSWPGYVLCQVSARQSSLRRLS